jgi:hypothetical protein
MLQHSIPKDFLKSDQSPVTFKELTVMAVDSPNSLSRKSLSVAVSRLLDDPTTLIEKSSAALTLASSKLNFTKMFHAGNAHGAATLSGYVLDVLFRSDLANTSALVNEVVKLLGQGVLHSDQYVSTACAFGLETAFKDNSGGGCLSITSEKVLASLTEAMKKYGIGEVSIDSLLIDSLFKLLTGSLITAPRLHQGQRFRQVGRRSLVSHDRLLPCPRRGRSSEITRINCRYSVQPPWVGQLQEEQRRGARGG